MVTITRKKTTLTAYFPSCNATVNDLIIGHGKGKWSRPGRLKGTAMKVEITHICGHKSTRDIVGKMADRSRKAEWFASQPCYECKCAAEAAARAEANADMVALTGSAKQIAWAETIRAEARKVIDAKLGGATLNAAQTAAIAALWAQTDAGWWIERRHNGLNEWLMAAGRLIA